MDSLWLYGYYSIPFFALVLDTLIGDPRSSYHPVVLIGNVISFFEKRLYNGNATNHKKFLHGMYTVLLVLGTVYLITSFILALLATIHPWLLWIGQVICVYITISPRSLQEAGREIATLLRRNKIERARFKLSWIVGRDTQDLDESEITRGAIETVAENTVDGIIAPIFFFLLAGPIGAILYRATNTMDSMLGYKNERYLYFGRFAARLDDVLNFIPARITFILFVIASWILRYDTKASFRLGLRDAHKHPSPNGGYAEAPVAGALDIRLGGYNKYGERVQFREYMGDPLETMNWTHIVKTIKLMYLCTILFVVFTFFVGLLLYSPFGHV